MLQEGVLTKVIFYVTGMGGRLAEGLGSALLARGFELDGRELCGEFRKLDFQQQVDLVAEDLATRHWTEDGLVIASSLGAYLFLHAQSQLQPYIGRVVLLSPIVGEFSDEDGLKYFVPPRAGRLKELAGEGRLTVPNRLEVYVGENDWQSNPANVQALFVGTTARVTVVPGAGHRLPQQYVKSMLDEWLQ